MKGVYAYITGCLLFIPSILWGYNNPLSTMLDTLKNDTIITTSPLILHPQKDSTHIQDPIIQFINQHKSKNKINSWIGNLLVINQDSGKQTEKIDYEKEYQRLNQKTIASIHFIRLDPFGTSIDDTTRQTSKWIEKTGNNLRFPTAKRIIRKNITFREGQLVDPRYLSESERLLRQLNFISDAKIILNLNSTDTTSVDVHVITRDKFPHAFTARGNFASPELTIYSRNLTGNGVGFAHTTAYESGQQIGNKEQIAVNNFEKTHINLEAIYSNMVEDQYYQIQAERSFYISKLKYAGGLLYNRSYETRNHPAVSQVEWNNSLSYKYSKAWLGRSFKLQTQNYFDDSHIYFIGMYSHSNFYNLPDSLADHPALINNDDFYGSITFSKRNYFRNNKIYNFDRTEDVPHGFMGTLIAGTNNTRVRNRLYLRAHFSFGKALIPNLGYLYGKIEAGSFFHKGQSEQGEIILSSKYISPLMNLGTNHLRNFLEVNYIKGFNRYPNEYLRLTEKRGGITSFNDLDFVGKERLVIKIENVLFTPHRIAGFNMMLLTFANLGIMGDGQSNLLRQDYQTSIGGAIRFINNKLVFKTIEIRLAWLPLLPNGDWPFALRIRGESLPRFNDFVPEAPNQDTYK